MSKKQKPLQDGSNPAFDYGHITSFKVRCTGCKKMVHFKKLGQSSLWECPACMCNVRVE